MGDLVLRPSYWASVSGGKDSLYMLTYILQNLDRYPLNGVVHYELEIDYPFISDVINYMETELSRYGVPLLRFKPDKSFHELYERYGYPSKRARWCNKEYKLSAEKKLKAFLRERGERPVQYIGFCADETKRFREQLNARGDGVVHIYPLAEAGIEEAEILSWARGVPIFNDFYKYNTRCGCMFCPMMQLRESAYILKYYPEHWYEMMRMAMETEEDRARKYGRRISVWHGNPKYDTAYRMQIVKGKYLPELEERIAREEFIARFGKEERDETKI